MRTTIPSALFATLLLARCGANRNQGGSTFHSETTSEVQVFNEIRMPNVRHILQPQRAEILELSTIIYFYDPNTKFGNLMFKHGGRWYAAGGFVGNDDFFVHEEAMIHSGVVVFVTPDDKPFNNSRVGPRVAYKITRGDLPAWDFYYIERDKFGDWPEYRDYFDSSNKKIIYPDY